MPDQDSVGVVVVTHDSVRFIDLNIARLKAQTLAPQKIVIVDSGSQDSSYLSPYEEDKSIQVLREKNVGFCGGNNLGAGLLVNKCKYILFLNPDCFISTDCLRELSNIMRDPRYHDVGIAGACLQGFDVDSNSPTGLMDCTGIFQTWFGRWYSRDQGRPVAECNRTRPEIVPAVTGAFMFCRSEALRQAELSVDEFFDHRFFMYKEDIDLALRLREKRWTIVCFPDLQVFHCRGWKHERWRMPRWIRLMSARNECRLRTNNVLQNPFSFKWIYSLCKYLYVLTFER